MLFETVMNCPTCSKPLPKMITNALNHPHKWSQICNYHHFCIDVVREHVLLGGVNPLRSCLGGVMSIWDPFSKCFKGSCMLDTPAKNDHKCFKTLMTMITNMKLSFLLFRFSRAFSVMFCGWIKALVIIFGRGVEYVECFLKLLWIVPHARNPCQKWSQTL